MNKLFIVFVFLAKVTFSQVTIQAEGYIKAANVQKRTDNWIIAKAGGYMDYPISASKSGVYTFNIQVLNDLGRSTYINVKTVTGRTNLASIPIPLSDKWQCVTGQVKLSSTTKTIRLVAGDDITLDYFSYGDGSNTPSQYVLKSDYDKLKYSFDSLVNDLRINVSYLDKDRFKWKNDDSTQRIVTIR